MGKDPGFIFYPGDYLRDTQCLSEKTQVAYDRIMCEHMRNISSDMNNITISQEKTNFFMKRLSEEEKEELRNVLVSIKGGFQIEWVALSISKRKSYSISRAENRKAKSSEDMNNICEHMDNANENDINNSTQSKLKTGKNGEKNFTGDSRTQSEELLLRRISEGEQKVNRNRQKDNSE